MSDEPELTPLGEQPAAGSVKKHSTELEYTPSTEDVPTGGETGDLIEALKDVIDPELMVNIVDLGLVYEIERIDAKVNVEMTLTSPACPVGPQIMQQAKMALERLASIDEATINLVMSPPWSPDRMTDDARDRLGIF